MLVFTVRPSNSTSVKEAFRIKLTTASLLSLKVKPGDLVQLLLPNDKTEENGGGGHLDIARPAIAWDSSGTGMKDNIVQTSKHLQELYNFKLGDKIGIQRCVKGSLDADTVMVRPLDRTLTDDDDQKFWLRLLNVQVPTQHEFMYPGLKFNIDLGAFSGGFEVVDVGGQMGRITAATKFTFSTVIERGAMQRLTTQIDLEFPNVGGLHRETQILQTYVDDLLDRRMIESWSAFQPRHGVLLYGPKGTGKSFLIEALSKCAWASVIKWSPGLNISETTQPTLIVVDLQNPLNTNTSILDLFEEIKGTQTLIVAETRHPNDVNERLRSRNGFSLELELPVPDSTKRHEILLALRGTSLQPDDNQLYDIALRTHGFVGMDLYDLLCSVWRQARVRCDVEASQIVYEVNQGNPVDAALTNGFQKTQQPLCPESITISNSPSSRLRITSDSIRIDECDIDQSLLLVRPSALQEVFLEKPTVRWSDIGGQQELKNRLTTAVQRTLSPQLRTRMARLGMAVTKGIFLYGPPGCSKTLLAKAVANESGLNFLAVKGAEVVSMYVGESERATREIFRKARAAAPSILFFDEIDSIASRGPSSSGSGGGGGGGGHQVLTTLLNEMDGFEDLKDVIVIAATNKPWTIDPALLRPGRFDHVVYVGLPDIETRKEIIANHFGSLDVDNQVRESSLRMAAMTEGHSGAEIVAICKNAGEAAFEEDSDTIQWRHVCRALPTVAKGATSAMLAQYDSWNAERGRDK